MDRNSIMKMIDIAAKYTAIGFAEWVSLNNYYYNGQIWRSKSDKDFPVSTEELYRRFTKRTETTDAE